VRIYDSAFNKCNALTDVYFIGSEEDWTSVTIGRNNDRLLAATIHFVQLTGDVDQSGTVDEGDVLLLRYYLAGWNVADTIDLKAADVNADGVIDVVDIALLTRYVAGWEGIVLG
jgi:hypothetical protein